MGGGRKTNCFRAYPFPEVLSPTAGATSVQISRTIRRGSYTDSTPTPDGQPFPIEKGEQSILEQYLLAIDAARETIYIEDQVIGSISARVKIDVTSTEIKLLL